MSHPNTSFVQKQSELDALELDSQVLGIDHEWIQRKTYFPIPSLAQISTSDRLIIVDLLQNLDLKRISEFFLRDDVQVICHDATSEMPLMMRVYKSIPLNILDTQLASSFVDGSGYPSYASLAKKFAGVEIDKSKQQSNWLKRPLDSRQLAYAFSDVRYLRSIWDGLYKQLQEEEKTEWFMEEQRLRRAEFLNRKSNSYLNLKGVDEMSTAEVSLLKCFYEWREGKARALNIPRRWLIDDVSLRKLVASAVQSHRELRSLLEEMDRGRWMNELGSVLRRWRLGSTPVPFFFSLQKKKRRGVMNDLRSLRDQIADSAGTLPDVIFRKSQIIDIVETYRMNATLPLWFGDWRRALLQDRVQTILLRYFRSVKQ